MAAPLSVDLFNPSNWQGSSNKDQLSAILSSLQKYDPGASMVTNPGTEYSNETGTGTRDPTYSLNYDPSKLPQLADPALQKAAETGKLREMYGGSQSGWKLANPDAKWSDPNYGDFTTSGNQYLPMTGHDKFIDIMGKITEGIAVGGMGAGLGAALGGGLTGALGSGAFKVGTGELLSGGKEDPLQAILQMFSGGGGNGGLAALLKLFEGQGG